MIEFPLPSKEEQLEGSVQFLRAGPFLYLSGIQKVQAGSTNIAQINSQNLHFVQQGDMVHFFARFQIQDVPRCGSLRAYLIIKKAKLKAFLMRIFRRRTS